MNTTLKLKGKKLYEGDRVVARIVGYREMHWKFGPLGSYSVFVGDQEVVEGFCYFKDAVKWARECIK